MKINQKGGMSQSMLFMIILFCCCCCYIYIILTCGGVAYYIYNKPNTKPKNNKAPSNTTSIPITTIPSQHTNEPTFIPTIYPKIAIFTKINGIKYYIFNNTSYGDISGNNFWYPIIGITNKVKTFAMLDDYIDTNKYFLFCENKDITNIVPFDKLKTNTEYMIIRNTVKIQNANIYHQKLLEAGGKQIFYLDISTKGNAEILLSNVCTDNNYTPLANLNKSMLLNTLYTQGSRVITKNNKLIAPYDTTAIFIIKESGVTNTTPQLLDVSKKYIIMNPTYKFKFTWYMLSNACNISTNSPTNSPTNSATKNPDYINVNRVLTALPTDSSNIIKGIQEWQFEIEPK